MGAKQNRAKSLDTISNDHVSEELHVDHEEASNENENSKIYTSAKDSNSLNPHENVHENDPEIQFVAKTDVGVKAASSSFPTTVEGDTGLSARNIDMKDGICRSLDEESKTKLRSKYSKDINAFLRSQDWNRNAPPLLGIDFGTSNTVVSFVEVANPQLIQVWKTDTDEELRPSAV